MVVQLITAAQLQQQADSANTLIIDTRQAEEYAAGHIPGAVLMAWEEWCAPAPDHLGAELAQPGYWGLLKDYDSADVEQRLSALGVSNDKRIVVYANAAKSKGREGRVAWMLLYYGARNVAILDGGFGAWRAAGGETQVEVPALLSGQFKVDYQHFRRVKLAQLRLAQERDALPLMIDTRTKKEFDGECYPYMPRTGAMPNSVLLAYDSIFEADGTFVTQDKYLRMIPPEMKSSEHTVAVCEVGVRASTVALLHEMYTGQIIPVYDGSIMEWGAEADLPMCSRDI